MSIFSIDWVQSISDFEVKFCKGINLYVLDVASWLALPILCWNLANFVLKYLQRLAADFSSKSKSTPTTI